MGIHVVLSWLDFGLAVWCCFVLPTQLYFNPSTVKMLSNLKVLASVLPSSHVLFLYHVWVHVHLCLSECTHLIPLHEKNKVANIATLWRPIQVLVIAVLLKIIMRRKFSIIQVRLMSSLDYHCIFLWGNMFHW